MDEGSEQQISILVVEVDEVDDEGLLDEVDDIV